MTSDTLNYAEALISKREKVDLASELELPHIKDLASSNPQVFRLLEIFAFGTLADLPPEVKLSDDALIKLRQLTFISMATHSRTLSYQELIEKLGVSSVRELEDLVIDAVYHDLIVAKLDSKRQIVQVDDWAARSVRPDVVAKLSQELSDWLRRAETVIAEANLKALQSDKALVTQYEKTTAFETKFADLKKQMEDIVNSREHNERTQRPSQIKRSRVLKKVDVTY